MIRQVPDKWNVIDTTTIYTIYMYMICYSLMFVVEVMQWSRYAMRRCWKLLRARCRSVARLSSFLLDIRGSWEIFQEHKIIHNIFESARARRVKTNQRPQNAYSTVLVSKYLLKRQQWRLFFFPKGVYFPWAMKNIWFHLDVHSLDNFTCVSVQKAMFILAVNSHNWGLEDFWPSECPFDSRRQHYLYWAIVPLNKNGAHWFLLMALQIKFPSTGFSWCAFGLLGMTKDRQSFSPLNLHFKRVWVSNLGHPTRK